MYLYIIYVCHLQVSSRGRRTTHTSSNKTTRPRNKLAETAGLPIGDWVVHPPYSLPCVVGQIDQPTHGTLSFPYSVHTYIVSTTLFDPVNQRPARRKKPGGVKKYQKKQSDQHVQRIPIGEVELLENPNMHTRSPYTLPSYDLLASGGVDTHILTHSLNQSTQE
jgi:hypothetical protein